MSDTALAAPPANAAKLDRNSRPPTGRTKQALDLMVHEGATDNEAAVQTGITVTAIRLAIQRRGVRAYLTEQREVARAHACARNIHRAVQIRDAADNMPAMHAIRYLDQMPESEVAAARSQRAPGVTVIVVQGGDVNPSLTRNDAKPLILHDAAPKAVRVIGGQRVDDGET